MTNVFSFYASFYEAIKALPDEKMQLKLFKAVCAYAFEDEEPQGDDIIKALFAVMRPNIDSNIAKREAGKKGGASKQEDESTSESASKQNESACKQNESASKQDKKCLQAEPEVLSSNKEKEKEKEEEKDIKANASLSLPSSEDDVREYCEERGINPIAFFKFYEARGWDFGTEEVTTWQQAADRWAASS